MLKDINWGVTPDERKAYLASYEADLNEIVATLASRPEANRAQTILFLKRIGVPNPFHPATGKK